ncbi:MAG: ATP-binding protein [Muribaculaceae bacterium]|nr:ATP-binding protein [Muribaculaceae bacterium]
MKLPLEFYDISQWLKSLKINSHHEYYLKLMEAVPEFHEALIKYDDYDPNWIFDMLQACSKYITDWLIACKDNLRNLARVNKRLDTARSVALYILEESDYLRACNPEQRTVLQSRLSNYVELFSQYILATTKILENTHEEFIDKMFSRLKEAGYLFNPSKQFRIMMTILKLCPELINTRMGELFEALHNWEISNWQSEPFRSALVEQLQIFIEENCYKINLLPTSDSSIENKAIIRMILAIAVQRLLSTESDNIDLSLNRAMLYRYISYLNPSSVDTLLNKGVEALLGLDIPNEFCWNDTDHPTLLLEKSSHPTTDAEDRDIVVKIYSTSKADVQLRSNSISVIARNADPSTTVIPNNIFDWLNPTVSLVDPLITQNFRKTKDIRVFRKMWDDIAWSIFGADQTAGERIEKTLPDGEEVKIIIDDVRILNHGHERQRLQFHCTIIDELYYGEGWMPCDAYHMLGWLSDQDIPSNYDGSLKFACSQDGVPLLFTAYACKKDDSLEFYMKSQIEDYLLETSSPGDENIAIVTYLDRINNAWLCLTERGSTYKVACDETTSHLAQGMLVRVRYIEPDRSNTTTQFFIGELSDNQEDLPVAIKKSLCLYNLMQGLGSIQEDEDNENFEVRETEEVLSKEELLELIYMYQRRAYSETEYLKAVNYLGMASILCKLAEENDLLRELNTHMDLLQLLQDFGKNQKINTDELERCETLVKKTPMLERLHTRLKIVADINVNENSNWLWNVRKSPRNETERQLASLVLSYNMLPKGLEKTRKEIMKEITTLLNVNNTTSNSKYYGDESQTVEFKSSLIYSTHGGNRPDIKEQLFEIVHIICGFMNARGGTLYIGVNDSGYENGLDDDLAYRKTHGMKPTIDAMIVDLQNHLDRTMPSHAKDHWEISSDPESKKGVIIVTILPVETPVELDGIIYVRSSSTTKPRLDEEREAFIKNRRHNYHLQMTLLGMKNVASSPSATPLFPEAKDIDSALTFGDVDNSSKGETVAGEETETPIESKKIVTGKHRLNILHSYENNFATPSLYIHFMHGGKVFTSNDDQFIEYEPECRLALAIREKELDGYVVITYSDGKLVKLPMNVFSRMNEKEWRDLKKGGIAEFVNVAGRNDYLLSIVEASFGSLFYRIDKLSKIPTNIELHTQGQSLCDQQHRIIAQEIVAPDKVGFFDSDAVDKEKRFYGVSLPQGDGTLSIDERIGRLLMPLVNVEQ